MHMLPEDAACLAGVSIVHPGQQGAVAFKFIVAVAKVRCSYSHLSFTLVAVRMLLAVTRHLAEDVSVSCSLQNNTCYPM